ncbi:MAG: DUF1705 domain-containing protein, partial [Brachymonas sp.]|nr:DUF1705 domain-containing protein [Brachymonas sp.]
LLTCAIYIGLAWLATRHVRVTPFARVGWQAFLARFGWAILGLQLAILLVLGVMQPLTSWMRNDKAARYLVTPSNVLWSGTVALFQDVRVAAKPRETIALDAKMGVSWAQRKNHLL